MDIKPIETVYNGYRFRSRLEARWAVFFDAIGVPYEYEPEGFRKDNIYYLPDFRLKCYGTRGECNEESFDLYVEVKGEMKESDRKKINAFSYEYDNEKSLSILVVGNIPNVNSDEDVTDSMVFECYGDNGFFNYQTIDGDYFGCYPSFYKNKFFLMGDDCNYMFCEDFEILTRAYIIARQTRFEHGETPTAKQVYEMAHSGGGFNANRS